MTWTLLCCAVLWLSGFWAHQQWIENKAMKAEEEALQRRIWGLEDAIEDNKTDGGKA